jgi:hypothetical protein
MTNLQAPKLQPLLRARPLELLGILKIKDAVRD